MTGEPRDNLIAALLTGARAAVTWRELEGKMRLSKAIEGFALYCEGIRKMRTTESYREILEVRFGGYLEAENIEHIENITHETLLAFFHWLEHSYKPGGWNAENIDRLSDGSIRKTWTVLRSFYKWASGPNYGIGLDNLMADFPMPKDDRKPVEPFSVKEVTQIIQAAKPAYSKIDNTRPYHMAALRNQAIIHVLLDVGIRNSELRNLKIGDYTNGRLHIRQGKGQKDRYVYLGQKANMLLWQYLYHRTNTRPGDWLFPLKDGRQIGKSRLQMIVKEIGDRAGVSPCYPHRFRHTCAVMRVLNGQSAETLMHVLGHTTINMSMYYVNLAKVDTSRIQRTASPVDNL